MRLVPYIFLIGILCGTAAHAQLIVSTSGEPVTTYDPGFPEFGIPPSLRAQATATPLPDALDLTGVSAGSQFTLELMAPAGSFFTFTPEPGSSDTSVEFRFRWFQFGVNIGGTAFSTMLSAESAEWINGSTGAPALSTSAFAFYQSSNDASNIQIVANANASSAFTFQVIRFEAVWAVDPNEVSVNWNERGDTSNSSTAITRSLRSPRYSP